MSYVFIDEEMWERLAKALRWFEAHGLDQPPPVTVTAPSGPLPPNLYEVTAVDTEAGTCTVQVVENATGDLLGEVGQIEDVEYPTSAEPSEEAQGTLIRIASGAVMFYEGGGTAKDPGEDVDTIGTNDEGLGPAEATAWPDDPRQGLKLYAMTRVAYYNAGDEKLYGYVRLLTFDSGGRLYSVGAETRVTIDTPGL